MKITMPISVATILRGAAWRTVAQTTPCLVGSPTEVREQRIPLVDELVAKCSRWVDEYQTIRVEIDLDAGTAKVLEVRP